MTIGFVIFLCFCFYLAGRLEGYQKGYDRCNFERRKHDVVCRIRAALRSNAGMEPRSTQET